MTGRVLAVDGGNSKTDLALLEHDGSVLAVRRGPTTSHQVVGASEAGRRLASLVARLAAEAGVSADLPPADLAVMCLAGMDLPSDARLLARIHADIAREVVLRNDTLAALRAGAPVPWGVAVVLGAGINAIGVTPSGREVRFAALGPISGDRGGGGGLGMDALGAAVRARDGRGPSTALERLVPDHFGLRRPLDVTTGLYSGRIPERRTYELAAVAVAAARDGDAVALGLLEAQADEAAAWAIAAIRRAGLARREVPVVLAGGLARGADPLLTDLVAARVRRIAARARVSVLQAPPVLGVALLALDRVAPDDEAARARARSGITLQAFLAHEDGTA